MTNLSGVHKIKDEQELTTLMLESGIAAATLEFQGMNQRQVLLEFAMTLGYVHKFYPDLVPELKAVLADSFKLLGSDPIGLE